MAAELFLKRVAIDMPDDEPLPNEYPFDLPAIRNLDERKFTSPVTVFVGENGSGKSTLLEALAVSLGLNAEGGSNNLRFSTRDSHSSLADRLRLTRNGRPKDAFFLRAESFYNVATKIEDVGAGHHYGPAGLHEQSHGEAFLSLVISRFGGPGIYLMDEPEAALSPQRQLSMLVRMHELVKGGSQIILATHSPMLMSYPGTDIWHFEEHGIGSVAAEDTEHWQLMRNFLNRPGVMLHELLRD